MPIKIKKNVFYCFSSQLDHRFDFSVWCLDFKLQICCFDKGFTITDWALRAGMCGHQLTRQKGGGLKEGGGRVNMRRAIQYILYTCKHTQWSWLKTRIFMICIISEHFDYHFLENCIFGMFHLPWVRNKADFGTPRRLRIYLNSVLGRMEDAWRPHVGCRLLGVCRPL